MLCWKARIARARQSFASRRFYTSPMSTTSHEPESREIRTSRLSDTIVRCDEKADREISQPKDSKCLSKEHSDPEKIMELSLLTDWENNLVGWDDLQDTENPKNWTNMRKQTIFMIVVVSCFMIPVASTIFAPGAKYMAEEFHITSPALKQLTISLYVLGFGCGPLLHAPLSELYGRKYVVACSNLLFVCLNVGCSEATSTVMFMIFRALSGILGCAGMVVGSGTISDIFRQEDIGSATAYFFLGPIAGPVLGPIVGGFVAQHLGWRWTFRVILLFGAIITLLHVLLVPETNPAVLLERKAKKLNKLHHRNDLISIIYSRSKKQAPFHRLCSGIMRATKLLIFSPIVLLFAIYMSIAYAYLYVFLTTIPTVFSTKYGWSTSLTGLAYIGIGAGTLTAVLLLGKTNELIVRKLTVKNGGVHKPEFRLRPMIVGSVFLSIGMFWYGWSVQEHAFWLVVVLSFFCMGFGLLSSLIPIQAYLIDIYGPLGLAASATAALNFLRCTAAAFIPLGVPNLIATLDYGWGYSIFGFLGITVCTTMALLFNKYGSYVRELFPPREV
ncbi:major facilitator superfamily domain-containing protein [Dipodascopsis tothii]|uniref:major facilitator superfamily domain-containing protein n=1 Tax=Dipodascopsis tothii TaxID=44089 RepID=UPI0034CFD8E9